MVTLALPTIFNKNTKPDQALGSYALLFISHCNAPHTINHVSMHAYNRRIDVPAMLHIGHEFSRASQTERLHLVTADFPIVSVVR